VKLPEQPAEAVLPQPEPPKPEPPKPDAEPPKAEPLPPQELTAPPPVMAMPNEAPPTAGVEAPQQPSPPSAAVRRWQSGLDAQITRLKHYPPRARARREQGVVRGVFRVDRNGRVVESYIIQSSGWPDLDQEFLSMLTRAQPLPKPPADVQDNDMLFVKIMEFKLD
jgi:protein TonB